MSRTFSKSKSKDGNRDKLLNRIRKRSQSFSSTGNLSRKSILEDNDGLDSSEADNRMIQNGDNNHKKQDNIKNTKPNYDDTKKTSSTSKYNRGVFKSPIISTLWAERSRKLETDNPFLKSHSDTIAQNNGIIGFS